MLDANDYRDKSEGESLAFVETLFIEITCAVVYLFDIDLLFGEMVFRILAQCTQCLVGHLSAFFPRAIKVELADGRKFSSNL